MIVSFLSSLRWITWLCLGICGFVTVFSTQLVNLVFGEAYASSVSLLKGHVWANVFMIWFYAQNVLEVELGLGKQLLIKSLIAVILNIALNFLLIPIYGAFGAVLSTIVGYAFLGLIGNLFFKKTRFLFFLLLKSLNPLFDKL
jgi:O-antigen/teichoic acid export membrane protein